MFSSIKLKHEYMINAYILFVKLLFAISIQKQKFHQLITLNIMGVTKILVRGKTLSEVGVVRSLAAKPPEAGEFLKIFISFRNTIA